MTDIKCGHCGREAAIFEGEAFGVIPKGWFILDGVVHCPMCAHNKIYVNETIHFSGGSCDE